MLLTRCHFCRSINHCTYTIETLIEIASRILYFHIASLELNMYDIWCSFMNRLKKFVGNEKTDGHLSLGTYCYYV